MCSAVVQMLQPLHQRGYAHFDPSTCQQYTVLASETTSDSFTDWSNFHILFVDVHGGCVISIQELVDS